jgi:hypothetical protein
MKRDFNISIKETCGICDESIDTSSDSFTTIIDYAGTSEKRVNHYHTRCFVDMIKAKKEIIVKKFEKRLAQTIKQIATGLKKQQNSEVEC